MTLESWSVQFVKRVNDTLDYAAEQTAIEGETMIKEFISTRGTGKTWRKTFYRGGKARSASKPGRVWTGDMIGDVDREVNREVGDIVLAEVGWIDNIEEYYRLQEGGFEGVSGYVEGMYAMRDTAALLPDRARQILKGQFRGL